MAHEPLNPTVCLKVVETAEQMNRLIHGGLQPSGNVELFRLECGSR